MSITTRKYGDGTINPIKLTATAKKGQYAFYNGDHQPQLSAGNGYSDPAGTTGTLAKAMFRGTFPLCADYYALGAGQTLLGPLMNTAGKGLEVTGDQVVDEGYEYVFGANDSRGPFAITVGTHNAFLRMSFEIQDVSDLDEVVCGFRKVEALQAAVADYDEAAYFNVVSGDIKVSTILNTAAAVTTDTGENWADGETHELELIIKGRQVSFYIDGDPAPGVPVYRFDVGEVVVPFFRTILDDTGAADATSLLWWKEVECGRWSDIDSNGTA